MTEQTGVSPARLMVWTPLGIALVLIFSMMSEIEEWLYVAVVIGLVASLAVGRTSGKPGEASVQARLFKFGKGWSLVVALAALSLLHGTWQPMVFFAIFGALSTACFWLGCKSSR
ncbi:MAG: hypothetical protein P0111_07965 [Nitrospira sp.]|nr:hypothetical protein [Nitrospira sp.]